MNAGLIRRVQSVVGPYREPAEDLEAGLDAVELAAFEAALARGAWRIPAGLVLLVLGPIVPAVAVLIFAFSTTSTPPVPSPGTYAPRCETRIVEPSAGAPFRMTICR